MSKLKSMFSLKSKVVIYVPATININETIDNTEYVEYVATKLSEIFGGATSQQVNGYWVSDSQGLVKESTTIVYSYCDSKELDSNIDTILNICEYIKKTLNQDAVGLEVNNEMYFI